MDAYFPILCVIVTALGIPAMAYWIWADKTTAIRGLAIILVVIGATCWANSIDSLWQWVSASMAAIGGGYLIYLAARGAQPPR
jgi:hypothetical protein